MPELTRLFAEQGGRTIHDQVAQNVPARKSVLQDEIRSAFAGVLQEVQNLHYADRYLRGIISEIVRTRDYWLSLEIPSGAGDIATWKAVVKKDVQRLMERSRSVGVRSLHERATAIEDELSEMLTRLEMFVMPRILDELRSWAEQDLRQRLARAREVLTEVRSAALTRANQIEQGLEEREGPLLSISRSEDRRFSDEIRDLARLMPTIPPADYVRFEDGGFVGLLPLGLSAQGDDQQHLFPTLRARIQPGLMARLQTDGPIDIVREIERQQFANSTAQRAQAASRLALHTTQRLMTGPENVPAYIVGRTEAAAGELDALLRKGVPALPDLHSKELPLLDHMALFYYEGGGLEPRVLHDAKEFERKLAESRKKDPGISDPLRLVKVTGGSA